MVNKAHIRNHGVQSTVSASWRDTEKEDETDVRNCACVLKGGCKKEKGAGLAMLLRYFFVL